MKIKIVEPGFATYTGPLIGIQFENGVSERELSEMEVQTIGSIMRVEAIEGGQVGVAVDLVARHGNSAPIIQSAPVEVKRVEKEVVKFTRAALEQIADKEGILGLRKITDELGVKGKSINVLIDGILERQGESKPAGE